MSILFPFASLLLSLILGVIIVEKLSFKPKGILWICFVITTGTIAFTLINYLISYILPFPKSVVIVQLYLLVGEFLFLMIHKHLLKEVVVHLKYISEEKGLLSLVIILGLVLGILFHTHILLNINGDLYTGESTYGDLPFHLSTISQIAYGQHFPPDNPLFTDQPLVYPYLINFFSAILVYEGLSLRNSIIIPGIMLSLALIGLVYGFAYQITKSKFISSLTTILYFFNGGLGFYFFFKDHSFNISSILAALSNPTSLKEYSHFFEQNIQWVNILSRMIVPERSLLFGIPAGLIILLLLFFREDNNGINFFDIILCSVLLSSMPLLHTHTALAFTIILPILAITHLKKENITKQILIYIQVVIFSIIFAIPYIPLFLNHIGGGNGFFKFHLGWMTDPNENFIWFWFKNSYLFIPLSLLALAIPKVVNKQTKVLLLCAFSLFLIMNLILFSPYNWDNVKLLFWIGLFCALASSCFISYLLKFKSFLFREFVILFIITMISSAALSIYREINVKFVLFSNDGVKLAKTIKQTTPINSRFLTYKIHNSPVSNLAGRQILMGYPGSLWVHGIKFQDREKDIDNIYAGSEDAKLLLEKYQINYVLLESYNPESVVINREFFNQYPAIIKTDNYIVYKIK